MIEWLNNNNELVANANGEPARLSLLVNDSIHNEVFTCRPYIGGLALSPLYLSIIVYGKC